MKTRRKILISTQVTIIYQYYEMFSKEQGELAGLM